MDKKKILIPLGCIIGILLVIGISYAYWSLTFTQTENNVVTTDCFEIEFLEGNAINLSKAYPVSDSDGMKNTPYTFTIKNICDSSAKYQINLESLEVSGKKLSDPYLKANLKEGNVQKITTKLDKELNPKLNTEPTIEGAVSAYKLYEGILEPNETKEYSLRLWMHSDVTASDKDSMNAEYNGKISIITSYYQDNRGTMKRYAYNSTAAFYAYRSNITKVVMEDVMNPKETELAWDVSEAQDGSVMSYLIPNEDNTTYTLYIQSEGGIRANPDSSYLFYNFSKLENIEGLEYFDTSKVTNMGSMFSSCSSLTNLDLSNFDTSNVTNMVSMFGGCSSLTNLDLSNFDTNNVTNMGSMFSSCSSLTNLDLSNFDTSNVTIMGSMFSVCSSLTNLDVSNFNTSNVTNMDRMFSGCSSLTNLDLSSFDTNNVTNMGSMFSSCSSLTNLDVSHFNTSNVKNMGSMFFHCYKLESLDVSHFNTNKVTNMAMMFYGCSKLINLDVSNFNTSNVTNMSYMFSECSSLTNLDLNNFDTSNVTNISYMFSKCGKLTNIVYGESFIHKEGANTYNLLTDCPANRPTHESWNGVQFS